MINSVAKEIIKKFNINKFIETGILDGETMAIAISWFCELYSTKFNIHAGASSYSKYKMYEVDIDPKAVETAKRIARGMNNIIISCDTSCSFINKLHKNGELTSQDNCFYFLDAHPWRANREEMVKPLHEEMEAITKQQSYHEIQYINETKRFYNNTIISIDDWAVKGERNDLYSEEDIKQFLQGRTDVVFHSKYPTIDKKYSCFIFLDRNFKELEKAVSDIDIVPVML